MSITCLFAHATAPRVTVKQVERYLELQERRRALLREADALQKIESALEAQLLAHVQAHAGRATKGKYTLTVTQVPGRPSWKTAFIRFLGETAAKNVVAHTPPTTKLTILGG
jgi:hypothetical protein